MAKSIVSVGLELASEDVSSVDFRSQVSLIDWDIVLFKPDISPFLYMDNTETYLGKPALSDDISVRLHESCEHWYREIREAVDAGKTVIGFLPQLVEVYIGTGEKKYSGTGRNRQATRIVSKYSNYRSVPIAAEPTSRSGSAIKIVDSARNVLASYWEDFGEFSEFRVTFSKGTKNACLVTTRGTIPVGLMLPEKSGGTLLLLPELSIDFGEAEEWDEDGNAYYTKNAKQLSAKLVSGIVALDEALRTSTDRTPEPSWISQDRFQLAGEAEVLGEILAVEKELEDARRRKQSLSEKLAEAGSFRDLLFETGKALEAAVSKALDVLGFSTQHYRDDESEFDVIFQSDEGRLLGEAEGKDSTAVGIGKLRQLWMNIHEDLNRENVEDAAKGILFGNGYRLRDPTDRPDVFTGKCLKAAESTATALVNTVDLFRVVQYLSYSNDGTFAEECRMVLLKSTGAVIFPNTPDIPVVQGEDHLDLDSGKP